MPADMTKIQLRALLADRTTEELEELLALDFAEDGQSVDADYISTILEVIEERENEEEREKNTREAWEQFRAYCREADAGTISAEDTDEKPTCDHPSIIEYRHSPQKRILRWRIGVVAAIVAALLCGSALGQNIFRVIAEWTEETFYIHTGEGKSVFSEFDTLESLRIATADYTDLPVVPFWWPEGARECEAPEIEKWHLGCDIGALYREGDRFFKICITVYRSAPEESYKIYQRSPDVVEKYVVNGIEHYILSNNSTLSAVWLNDCVEVSIHGELTIEELREMIDSIYKE